MNKVACVLGLGALLALAGCEQAAQDEALENVDENPQEYYNTATDPAGPRELTGPGANTGTGGE